MAAESNWNPLGELGSKSGLLSAPFIVTDVAVVF